MKRIPRHFPVRPRLAVLLTLAAIAGLGFWRAQAAGNTSPLESEFEQTAKPFLAQNCLSCHNADLSTAGVRVDNLDATLQDRQIRTWESIRHRISNGTMPPKGLPQPAKADRDQMVDWITRALDVARSRPTPKNGIVRRLTVAQYRNTLKELLLLDDDLTETLPPEAVSRDGFVNNKETLNLSPLLMDAYFEIAEDALNRAIVDPKAKPKIQNFRMDLGASINPNPLKEELILGANSLLLENQDFTVTQLTAKKPFPFDPFFMRTKYRFIEGYQGNDTVRGWRDFDSIYHAVFACMRGSRGYPKGEPYNAVPEGLLLRPAIPNDELFDADGTYGPKANFKISLRELPDQGRFRVTVTAAKYEDGLLLDASDTARTDNAHQIVWRAGQSGKSITVPAAGVYQVDLYEADRPTPPAPAPAAKLTEGLAGVWPSRGQAGQLDGRAELAGSPIGTALSIHADEGSLTVPRAEAMNVGEGDFTVAAWIHPKQFRRTGIVSLGSYGWTHGWYLETPDNKGTLRLETAGPDKESNGSVSSPPGVLRAEQWQHVAAVVRRGKKAARLYVNGYLVAQGDIGAANLDNPDQNLVLGRIAEAHPFEGEIADARIYRRALSEAELQTLIEPGKQFADAPPEKPQKVEVTLGGREFSGILSRPAFLAVRLNAGQLPVAVGHAGIRDLDRLVLTPLAAGDDVAERFAVFEKRSPRLGVHLGLRRDCGSTLARVGTVKTVSSGRMSRFVFEGAIRNYPSPDVEKDNVNYLAGVREIGVRSEYTDGRDMPRLVIRSVEFEGPFYETWPPKSHRNVFVASPHASDRTAYAREIVHRFASRAYRRPVTAAEESALMAMYEKSSAAGRSFEDSIKETLQVVLTSPQFLFLVENSSSPQPEPLDDYELGSKLSYFLWNGPPDAEILKLAEQGKLRQQLNQQVDRMIADARFSRFLGEFVPQWLSLEKFQVLEPDRKQFPDLTRHMRTQLEEEPVQFVEYLIRHNLPARNLVSSDFVLANEAVASYYGLGDKTESGFDFVAIPNRRRDLGGVLTEAALMAGLSDGRESNPVKRGAWLARKIIAEPPPDPPPNVPALAEDTKNLTLRQRLEQHRNQPGCLQCHTKIDPWGVALEEFDASGRLKKGPVDAESTLPDNTRVSGIDDLRRYLAEDRIDQVAFSVLKHLETYANGRNLTYNEVSSLKADGLALKPDGYRMKDLIRYVVNSKVFLEK